MYLFKYVLFIIVNLTRRCYWAEYFNLLTLIYLNVEEERKNRSWRSFNKYN